MARHSPPPLGLPDNRFIKKCCESRAEILDDPEVKRARKRCFRSIVKVMARQDRKNGNGKK